MRLIVIILRNFEYNRLLAGWLITGMYVCAKLRTQPFSERCQGPDVSPIFSLPDRGKSGILKQSIVV